MISNKIKCILVLFIILSLSMNAFSATNFTDDSNDVALQSTDSVDKVANEAADEVLADSEDTQADDNNQNTEQSTTNSNGTGTSTKPTFNFNSTGTGMNFSGMNFSGMNFSGMNFSGMNFSGMNGTSFGGNNSSGFDFDSFMDLIKQLMGGNETNTTNVTNETVAPEVSDVPAVATSTSYAPVSHPTVEKQSQYTITRVRDNKLISQGDTLKLEGINKLYDSDFTNGHLLVYIDGKLVFNELTAGDLATPIFGITDSYLGQHQITVEFTPDGDSNTNKYTEDVMIS